MPELITSVTPTAPTVPVPLAGSITTFITSAPAAPNAKPEKNKPASTFNRAQLEDVELAEKLVGNARIEPYKSTLASGAEIKDGDIQHLENLCATARRRTARAVQSDTAESVDTLQGYRRRAHAGSRAPARAGGSQAEIRAA